VALQGTYLVTSNVTHQITSLSFLAPLGYVQLFADEGVGADHLDLKLSASGETLTLADNTGGTIQSISFAAQTEGVSQGRLPEWHGQHHQLRRHGQPRSRQLSRHLDRPGH
jgi:hypothetical protein